MISKARVINASCALAVLSLVGRWIYNPFKAWDCADAQLPAACRWVAHDVLRLPMYIVAAGMLLAIREKICLVVIHRIRAKSITILNDWRVYTDLSAAGHRNKRVWKSMQHLAWFYIRSAEKVIYLAPADGDALVELARGTERTEHINHENTLLVLVAALVLLPKAWYTPTAHALAWFLCEDARHLVCELFPAFRESRPPADVVAIPVTELEAGAENGTLVHAGRVYRNPVATTHPPYAQILESLRTHPKFAKARIILRTENAPALNAAEMPTSHIPGLSPNDIARKAERTEDECIICRDNARAYLCVPCGHHCICGPCAGNLRNRLCPGCSQTFTRLQRVYEP